MARINMNGITTVVGLSETDGLTRSVENLYAKTHTLCEEGDALVPAFVANLSKLMTSLPNIIIAVAVALRFCPRCRRRCIRLRSDTVPHVEVPKKLDK